MTRTPFGRPSLRLALAALLALSLVVGALATSIPGFRGATVALADDNKGKDKGGDLDEDDDSGKGNGDDNPGNGNGNGKEKKDKGDDETDLVTAVPTATAVPVQTQQTPVPPTQARPTQVLLTPVPPTQVQPTRVALTPVASPARAASTPVTTGTLAVSLRVCPDGIDATGGTDALAETCVDGKAGAVFELAGRTGLYGGWRRDLTTKADGTARAAKLAEGTYALTLDDLDWCAAEASNVADGLIVVEPGETTEVTAYLCGDPTVR